MKLVEILARELMAWPHDEAKICVQDRDGSRDVKFSASTNPPVFDKDDGVWRYALDDGWRGKNMRGSLKFVASELACDAEISVITRNQWQAARAAYLASIQPERDAEIAKVVGGTKKLPYAFTEADIRAAFAAGVNWALGAVEDGAKAYVEKLKGKQ